MNIKEARMKLSYHFKILSLTICILSLFLISTIVSASGENKLTVKSIHRISHPAYVMSNLAETFINPWNVDYSRILMYENDYTGHPDFAGARVIGRNMIWGCLKDSCVNSTPATSTLQDLDLDNASSSDKKLTAWDSNTFKIPSKYRSKVYWSPYPGEPNIVYVLNSTTKMLVTYNVDTGVETPIISYDHASGVAYAQIIGFSKDAVTGDLGHQHELIIKLCYSSSCSLLQGDTWRVFTDRQVDGSFGTPTRTFEAYALSCDAKMVWYPDPHNIHGSVSPDGLYTFTSQGAFKNDFDGDRCETPSTGPPFHADEWWYESYEMDNTIDVTHICAFASNDWFIGGNSLRYPFNWIKKYAPYIGDERIYQVYFDRAFAATQPIGQICNGCYTLNLLISRPSAGPYYTDETETNYVNYNAYPSPTISKDGLHLHFQGTNGKYTNYDYDRSPEITGSNWEGAGAYIADLAPASSGNDTTPPAAPQGLTVQ